MGLTGSSVGKNAAKTRLELRKQSPDDRVAALAGNPNVGKSTVFNGLTGMHQHTGNWPGKTVVNAQGNCASRTHGYVLVDIPGTYSLMAHSQEEEVARNFILFGKPDAVAVVCDATCLERNLNLVLQTMETGIPVVVCVNLLDEARRKGIRVDLNQLSDCLGVPVIGTVARKKSSLRQLPEALDQVIDGEWPGEHLRPVYCPAVEAEVERLLPVLETVEQLDHRWLALRLLDGDPVLLKEIERFLGTRLEEDAVVAQALEEAHERLQAAGLNAEGLREELASTMVLTAQAICGETVRTENRAYDRGDRRLDRILTGRWTAFPVMLALLALVFFLTISGANWLSSWLSAAFTRLEAVLEDGLFAVHAPDWLRGMLMDGVYRVLSTVISVMLPPMAIFFPLFTLLEDSGYLPRVAYNLDRPFQKCSACGKQALTMMMGFGCNAAGVVGCRIIDSPRERLLAILTNNFVPCNGRFPTLIALLTMFFVGTAGGFLSDLQSALLLTVLIVLGVGVTFAATSLLAKTVLRGVPSSFALEMPPYRRPQLGKVLVRSVFDRTLFVLGRAAVVAAPTGLVLWVLANVTVDGVSILSHCSAFLDPVGRLLGMDGVILMAFLLGLPANEIVLPIAVMAYLSNGSIQELGNLAEIRTVLTANGWTWVTALCVMLFSLMHWPCSTTLMTIKKETGSWKWTAMAAILPTAVGTAACLLIAALSRLWT